MTRLKKTIFYIFLSTSLLKGIQTDNKNDLRNYDQCNNKVEETYRLNHENQTVEFVKTQQNKYFPPHKMEMGIWDALEYANSIIDESDPDLELSQLIHALQTAEAIRADQHPRWLILTGLIHDLGKLLYLFEEPQWAVVGDTFPVGCAFSKQIIFYEFFKNNPDFNNPDYKTKLGMYSLHGGLDNVLMSWGHDEYLYQIAKDYLPEEAGYIIRYHSFYAQHKNGSYDFLLNEYDQKMFEWVKLFNKYDLYSKNPVKPDVETLKPYYQELIAEFFPEKIYW